MRLRIWIIRDSEPLPAKSGRSRIMRAGMLAQALARRGHDVTWLTSSFDHYRKAQNEPRRQTLVAETGLTIEVIPAPGYRQNVSLARIWHNRVFARAFSAYARAATAHPDIVISDIPTTETAAAVVDFARRTGIPSVLSIRDLWPDFFADHLPEVLRPLAPLALYPMERQARFACANATSLVGISPGYLEWGRQKGRRRSSTHEGLYPLGYAPRPRADATAARTTLRQIGLRDDARIVAFIGSWGHTYDLRLLLETIQKLSDRSDIQFVVAGDGPQADELRPRFAALPAVCQPGWINADAIATILRKAEVGLLPYKPNAPQGWPNKAFEYMAYGTYQIATLPGELEALYTKTRSGIVVPHPSPDRFARAITDALDNSQLAKDRAARIRAFEENFLAERIYNRFADHIERVAHLYA